ncbi:MAG: trypsin-like peptidase domain-containing protein [Sandaracinus sp.]
MSERPPAPRRPSPASTSPSSAPSGDKAKESPVHLVLRFVSMGVGLPLLTIAIGSWLGLLIESPWVALGVAAVITVLPTLLLADRLLPEDDPRKGNGIATDVIALVWLGGATLVMGPLAFLVHEPLHAWTERAVGPGLAVTVADFLTGSAAPEPAAEPTASPEPRDDDAGVPDDAGLGEPPADDDAAVDDGAHDAVLDADLDADLDAASEPDAGTDAASASAEMSPAEIFRSYADAVVSLEVETTAGREGATGRSGGTGFVLDARGVVATNHHVIDGARNVRVKLLDGSYADSVELLVDDAADDLALLQIVTTHVLHAVRLGDSDRVEVGERAVVIGNPLGLEHTLSDGLVSARRRIESHNMIQMTAPVSPGNSGGPVFDRRGEVIGVTTAVIGLGYGQNLNLAVPVNVLRAIVRDEYPDRRAFGAPTPSGRGGHW